MLYGQEITIAVLGKQWSDAGTYVRFLSLLGFALVIRGLINIILINERRARRLMFFYAVSILFIYPISLGAQIILELPLLQFVKLYGLLNLVYWLGAMIRALWIVENQKSNIWPTTFYVLLIIVFFVLSGSYLKSWLLFPWYYEMLLVLPLASLLTIIGLYLIFPDLLRTQLSFIKERLPFGQFIL